MFPSLIKKSGSESLEPGVIRTKLLRPTFLLPFFTRYIKRTLDLLRLLSLSHLIRVDLVEFLSLSSTSLPRSISGTKRKTQNLTTVKMALVSSTLNPDAPLFIPAAVRQVEDFSPEWWQLVTNSTWYHNYWLSLNPDGFNEYADEDIHGDNTVDLLPDSFDLDAGEDFSVMEAQYEEFLQLSEIGRGKAFPFAPNGVIGDARNAGETKQSIVKSLDVEGLGRRAVDPAKYVEKPARNMNSNYSPRCIQQPR